MERIEYAKFMKISCWFGEKDVVGYEEQTWIENKVAINPMHVTSYHGAVIVIKGEKKQITNINVSGSKYYANVSFKEFDKFFDEVQRGAELL